MPTSGAEGLGDLRIDENPRTGMVPIFNAHYFLTNLWKKIGVRSVEDSTIAIRILSGYKGFNRIPPRNTIHTLVRHLDSYGAFADLSAKLNIEH